jgi:peptidoglycan/LPS O-acetylase OafA/YrhL
MIPPALDTDGMPRVLALDGLRGLAILPVMLTHFVSEGNMTPVSKVDEIVSYTLTFGWVGVELFFVLSGFLITGILLDSQGAPHYFRNFYIRRTLRIFPLYYGFLALWLGVLPLFYTWPYDVLKVVSIPVSPGWSWAYLTNIIQALHDDWRTAPPYTTHFWSLAIEEQFYLVWPTVVFLCSRRRLVFVCIGLVLMSIATRIGLVLAGYYTAAYFFTPARLDGLAIGAIVAVAARRPGGLHLAWYVPPLIAGAAVTTFIVVVSVPVAVFEPYAKWVPASALCNTALACWFAALLIMAIDHWSVTARVCRTSVLRFFGRYSYALYVFHMPVAYFVGSYWFKIDSAPLLVGTRLGGFLVFTLIAGSVSVACALVSWHLYEKQFLKLKDRFAYNHVSDAQGAPRGTPPLEVPESGDFHDSNRLLVEYPVERHAKSRQEDQENQQ